MLEFGAVGVSPDQIVGTRADIFAPCAMGGIINDETIPTLKAEIVVGSANNQPLEPRHGDQLHERGKLYAPDYVANAGGIINGCQELLSWQPSVSAQKVEAIYDTMLELLDRSGDKGTSPFREADQMAEQRLTAAKAGYRA